jgi:hypothetical protein
MGRLHRGAAGLALLAALALAIGVIVGPSATAFGGGATASSLKGCLKKAKKKKTHHLRKKAKKKCHKKYEPATAQPTPTVRATLTWDANPPGGGSNIDLDLWVFDSNGNKARAAADTIPNTSFSSNDTTNPGVETFTDSIYTNPGGRNFSYGVCYQDGGSQHTIFKLDYVTADGVHHSASQEFGSDGASASFNGGAPIPANFCKAP